MWLVETSVLVSTFEKVPDMFKLEDVDKGLLRCIDIITCLMRKPVLQKDVRLIQNIDLYCRRTPASGEITVASKKTNVVALKLFKGSN